jgi:hypothetical protein
MTKPVSAEATAVAEATGMATTETTVAAAMASTTAVAGHCPLISDNQQRERRQDSGYAAAKTLRPKHG